MDEDQLHTFRKEWKDEIKKKEQTGSLEKNKTGIFLENTGCIKNETSQDLPDIVTPEGHDIPSNTQNVPYGEIENQQKIFLHYKKQKPEPVSLLTIAIPSYQQNNVKRNKECISSNTLTLKAENCDGDQDFISLLIRDIDEITTIPFFDVSLPKEVCVKIFTNLGVIDLSHCACVSKAWQALANDELIWQNIYKKLGFDQLPGTCRVSDQSDWKGLVKDNVLRQRLTEKNWKEMICKTQTLEYEKGVALSTCKLYKNVLVAGYANGKICLWDTGSNWRHFLEPSPEVIEDPSKASAECVSLHSDICASGFLCGMVNIWHTDISVHPVYQYKLSKPANHVILASLVNTNALLLSSCDSDIRIDQIQDDGQWGIVRSKSFENQITAVNLLQSDSDILFAIAMKENVVMYKPKSDSLVNLDTTIGTKITAMTTNGHHIAIGWAPYGFGVGTEFTTKVRLYDKNTLRHTQTFVGQYGEITCVNLSYTGSVVTGSKDKQVRIYDFRTEQPQLCLRGQSSITTVQMDSWKVVSGSYSGTINVWDMRMGTVLWETTSHHPVRLCHFDHNQLVTANIPIDKVPRESMWYADDLILHRRHRGSVKVYDFSGSSESVVVPEEMRSSYDDTAGYNYNINLVAPYDELTSEIN